MTYKDIVTKRSYTAKDGKEKTVWLKCGTVRINDDGKTFIEMFHQPETVFYVFEQKKKEEGFGG